MRPESYQVFAQLLETFLPESSTAMAVMGSVPGGRELIKTLHRDYSLAHDQRYDEVEKISWSDLKGNRYGAWVLIKGSKSAGAIRAEQSGSYQSAAFDPNTNAVDFFSDDRGGNNIDWLKNKIGKLRSFYIGISTGDLKQKQMQRTQRATQQAASEVNHDTLVNKFRPLWLRTMTAAEADIKGMIAVMIKNSAYEKAQRKMEYAKKLSEAIESLETGTLSETPSFLKSAVNLAVMMAAAHYYPEKTGEITRDRGYSRTTYSSQFSDGPRLLLRNIASGDTSKLGTVLAFFKRSLVAG